MYIIVKDVRDDDGGKSKRTIVLNRASYSEVFRSKNRALMFLKEIIEETEEEYEELNDSKYEGLAYSLCSGYEIFYVYKLYLDNRL